MRGAHRVLGRQDYCPPPQLSEGLRQSVLSVSVAPRHSERNKPHHWHAVSASGTLLGFVTTRAAGQMFRGLDDSDWRHAANDWHPNDPMHGKAITALLAACSRQEAA